MGCLIYLTIIRPIIAFLVGLVSYYMQASYRPHLDVAKKILRYVYYILDIGLLFKKGVGFELHGFSDADLSNDLDDWKYKSSYFFFYGLTNASVARKNIQYLFLKWRRNTRLHLFPHKNVCGYGG